MSKDAESQPYREPLSTGHKPMSQRLLCHPHGEKQTRGPRTQGKATTKRYRKPSRVQKHIKSPRAHTSPPPPQGEAAARGTRCSARKHLQRDISGWRSNPSDPPLSPCRSRRQLQTPRTLRRVRSRHRPQSPGIGVATMALSAASRENPSQSSLPAAPALYRSCAVVLQRLLRLGGKKHPRNPPASARPPCPPPLSHEPGAHR